jgi:hypothetical protein
MALPVRLGLTTGEAQDNRLTERTDAHSKIALNVCRGRRSEFRQYTYFSD